MFKVTDEAFISERAGRTRYFSIGDLPIALARPRFTGHHVYDSQKQRKLIMGIKLKEQMRPEELFSGTLAVDLTFYFPLPNRMSRKRRDKIIDAYHTSKPDLDNLVKLILDCASNNVLFKDDAIIARIVAEKKYGNPRTEITIRELI